MLTAFALVVLAMPLPQDGTATRDPVAAAQALVDAAASAHGQESVEVAQELMKLAAAQQGAGDLRAALASAEHALAIRREKLSPEHQRTAITEVNVGGLRMLLDDVEGAKKVFEHSRDVLMAAPPSRARIAVVVNLGVCQVQLGDYVAALSTLQAGVAEAERIAPGHPYHALALQNLAQVQLNLGDVEAARRSVAATLEMFANSAPDGAQHAHALLGLGLVLVGAGRADDATPLLQRAHALRAQLHGEQSLEAAACLAALALAARQRGDLKAAADLLEQALAACERAGDHQRAALRRLDLAELAVAAEDPRTALRHVNAARAAAREHPLVGASRARLPTVEAEAMLAAKRLDDAAAAALRACEEVAALGLEDSPTGQEARHTAAVALFAQGRTEQAAALAWDNVRRAPSHLRRLLPRLAEQDRLRAVTRLRLDLDLALHASARSTAAPFPAGEYALVARWKHQVGRALQAVQYEARRRPDTAAWLVRIEQIEQRLAVTGPDPALVAERDRLTTRVEAEIGEPEEQLEAPEVTRVLGELPSDGAVIDFVRYHAGDGDRFAAFVSRGAQTQRVDLGDATAIERAVTTFVRLLARSTAPGSAAAIAPAARAVQGAVWEPLREALGGSSRLWIAPDDVIATLPFAALPGDAPDSYLVEQCTIHYVTGVPDLLAAQVAAGERIVAVGDVDYGDAPPGARERGAPAPFVKLPSTARELDDLAAAAGQRPFVALRGRAATELALREAVVGAGYVHFATHGFVAAPRPQGPGAGLALALANASPELLDGVLTVAEAALLDLSACRLVVLSACETALGEPLVGEGLLGMRRAVRIAGAGASLSSVWRVEDTSTADLMRTFYRALFGAAASPTEALRTAQIAALTKARQECGEGLPGRWAGFVAYGPR